jgi:prevent-host-death family protein
MLTNTSIKTVIGATEVRNHFGKLLNEVYRGAGYVVVEKAGIPVADLVNMKEYEEFRRWLARKLMQEMGRKMSPEYKRRGVTEETLIDLMEEDRDAVFQQMYNRKG